MRRRNFFKLLGITPIVPIIPRLKKFKRDKLIINDIKLVGPHDLGPFPPQHINCRCYIAGTRWHGSDIWSGSMKYKPAKFTKKAIFARSFK